MITALCIFTCHPFVHSLHSRHWLTRQPHFLIAQGKGDDEMLQAIRAHGNFTEYVPNMLMLLFLLERSGVADMKLRTRCSVFRGARDAWHLHGLYEIQHAVARRRHGLDASPIGRSGRRLAHANPSGVRAA